MAIKGHDNQLLTQPLAQLGDEDGRSNAAMGPEREVGDVPASLARDGVQVAKSGAKDHFQLPIAIDITKSGCLQHGMAVLAKAQQA